MKKYIFLPLLIFILIGCVDKSVSLPQVAISGKTEIQNHSQIWVFQDITKEGSIKATVNKNNIISATNWIINIDKHLPMSEIIPVFQMIKAKRAKKSIHSVEGMKDYLSYSNTLDKNISVFSIDSIQFMLLSKEKLAMLNQDKICENTINFSSNDIRVNNKKYTVYQWNKTILDSLKTGCVQLQYNEDLSYQKYMEYRLSVIGFLPKGVSIETTEYVYK